MRKQKLALVTSPQMPLHKCPMGLIASTWGNSQCLRPAWSTVTCQRVTRRDISNKLATPTMTMLSLCPTTYSIHMIYTYDNAACLLCKRAISSWSFPSYILNPTYVPYPSSSDKPLIYSRPPNQYCTSRMRRGVRSGT